MLYLSEDWPDDQSHRRIAEYLHDQPYRNPLAIAQTLISSGRPFVHRRSGVRLGQLKLYLATGQPCHACALHVGRSIEHVITDPGVYDQAHRMIY